MKEVGILIERSQLENPGDPCEGCIFDDDKCIVENFEMDCGENTIFVFEPLTNLLPAIQLPREPKLKMEATI